MSEFSGLRVSGEGVLPPPDSGKGVRGTGDVCRRGSQDASVPSHLAATRGAARGKRRGTYSRTAKGKVCSKSKLCVAEVPGVRPLPPRIPPVARHPPGSFAGSPTLVTESCARRPGLIDFSPRGDRGEQS